MSYLNTFQRQFSLWPHLIMVAMVMMIALSVSSVYAQQTVKNNNTYSLILSDPYTEHFLSPYLTKYHDAESDLSVDDIISKRSLTGELLSGTGSIISLDTAENSIWLTFDVMNRSQTEKWKLDFGNSFMGRFGLFDKIESYVYQPSENILTPHDQASDGSLPLTIPVNQKSLVIIKLEYKAGLPTTIPLRLLHYEEQVATGHNNSMLVFLAFFIGMISFFCAVAYTQTQTQTQTKYLYFVLYYSLFGALLLAQNLMTVAVSSFLGSALIPFLFLMISISGFIVARVFWRIEDKPTIFHVLFIGFIIFVTGVFLAGYIFPIAIPALQYAVYYAPSLLVLIVISLVCIVQSQRGRNEITAFMFAWFILLFGACITILSLAEIIPPVSTAINAFWYTLIPQAFFFMVATKIKLQHEKGNVKLSRTFEIEETETVTRLRESKETTEQDRLLKVIEQERKVLGELRKSESRQTEEMRVAKNLADQANKAKSAFLAVVSHEIRTPMTGIMGMVRLLLNSNLTKEQKEYAQTIQDSSDAMLALLNDILDYEKIEQGKMTFENISFDLHRFINGVATLMKGHTTQKNIELITKMGDDLPKYVYGDPSRLRQILLNLAGNAVKFTDKGHVTLSANLMRRLDNNECEIYFGVIDSGVGISKEAQKELFSPFSQADTSISRKFGGTGLGLAISKGLVNGMGSTINISSNEGEGSTFFFTLKMPIGHSDNHATLKINNKSKTDIKPQKILVVDDNEINQKVIEGFLESTPHSTTCIDNAQIALNRLEKEDFDLILMDIEMPGIKGDEATKIMRSSKNEKINKIPIIALTGNTMPQDIERYYLAGINGYVSKPIDIDLLKSTINKAGENVFDNPFKPMIEETNILLKTTQPPAPLEDSIKKKSYADKQNLNANNVPEGIFIAETIETLKGHLKMSDIQEMLEDVLVKNDEIILAMQNALTDNKMSDLSARAHELKGMAGNFGLMEMSGQAAKIEQKAKTEASLIITGLLDPLPEMQERAKKAIYKWLEDNKG